MYYHNDPEAKNWSVPKLPAKLEDMKFVVHSSRCHRLLILGARSKFSLYRTLHAWMNFLYSSILVRRSLVQISLPCLLRQYSSSSINRIQFSHSSSSTGHGFPADKGCQWKPRKGALVMGGLATMSLVYYVTQYVIKDTECSVVHAHRSYPTSQFRTNTRN
jgi:hypothetical protein